MLLSIVMMVKNEERYLDKTLSALNYLRSNINSELIILDTGSIDDTINIAKKYTDKVYFENWNNNFSDMRNKSISYAKGDWILVLDADEVLVNCDKLIGFFNTELHKKYNSGTIELMNIKSEDEKEYNLVSILRLFKNEKGFCYEGNIHEQPRYKAPVYNDISTFKHYGYMFSNKDLLNKKYQRNGKILLEEINKNPNDPYTNYQLGKNYLMLGLYEDAIYYIENCYKIYKKTRQIPSTVASNLAQLYIATNQYSKCEYICLDYIKNDKKNIDIYFYLGVSQSKLEKSLESIKNLEKYIHLIENYQISTQANSMECECLTIQEKETAKLIISENYHKLEKYKEVLEYRKCIANESLSKIYYILIHSLYKSNKSEGILEEYNNLRDDIEKNKFIDSLEILITSIREEHKKVIYNCFCNIDDNYGKLNKLRLENELNIKECNEILKNENNYYFADIIYYLMKRGINLEEIIKDISLYKLEVYITYLINNKNDFESILFDYIDNKSNTLDFNNLKIESTVCKLLCKYSSLPSDKYKHIFLSYIPYRYNYLQVLYNVDRIQCSLSDIVNDKDDKFVLDLYSILGLKRSDKLSFIRKIRDLLKQYPEYKKGIQYLLNDIEKDIYVSYEMDTLKKEYKSLIEKIIASNDLSKALEVVSQYEEMFGNEEMYNTRAVINLYIGNIEESEKLLKLSYINDPFNEDTIFNIAYIKERSGNIEEAISFYKKVLSVSKDDNLKNEVILKLNTFINQK